MLLLGLSVQSFAQQADEWDQEKCNIDSLVNLKTLEIKLSVPDLSEDMILKLDLPNYTKLKCDEWGDWGPMYTFPGDEGAVQFSYTIDGNDYGMKTKSYIKILSPRAWKVRDLYPLYQEIPVPGGKVLLKVWYEADKLGNVEAIYGKPHEDNTVDVEVVKYTTYK